MVSMVFSPSVCVLYISYLNEFVKMSIGNVSESNLIFCYFSPIRIETNSKHSGKLNKKYILVIICLSNTFNIIIIIHFT